MTTSYSSSYFSTLAAGMPALAAEIHFGHSYLPLKSDPFNSEQSAPSLKGITDCEKLVRREPKQLLRPKRCKYSKAFLKRCG